MSLSGTSPTDLSGIPFVGYLIDARPVLDIIVIMGLLGATFGALTLFTSTTAQVVGIGSLVLFRPLFYTAIS